MMLELFPLGGSLDGDLDVAVNPDVIREAQKKRPTGKRLFKDLKRKETAAQAVAELERDGMEIFGLTRGQFSLSDMIEAILQKIGPARMSISTWTAAQVDISRMMELLRGGLLTDCRWLVDLSFIRRTPELCNQIREQFGLEAVRVMRTHAKFVLLENDEWRIALRSSMNLNQNPRLESYQVGHDPELCDWLGQVLDDVWRRQPRKIAENMDTAEMGRWWQEEIHGVE
jgi:hypothetical protein